MRCAEIMKRNVQTVREADSVQWAAEKMAMANVGFLPVCDEMGRVLGAITDRDITIRSVAKGRAPGGCLVGEVMTRQVVACRPDDTLSDAERLMAQHQKSRVVITDGNGVLMGVISLSDIAENEPARRTAKTLRQVAAREAPHA